MDYWIRAAQMHLSRARRTGNVRAALLAEQAALKSMDAFMNGGVSA